MDENSNESDDDSCGVVFDRGEIVPLVRGVNNDGIGEDGDVDEKHDDETNGHTGKDEIEENVHEEVATLLNELQERLSALVAKYSHILQLIPPDTSDMSDIRVVVVRLLDGTQNLSRCVATKDMYTCKLSCGVMEEHTSWFEVNASTILRGIDTDPNWAVNLPRQLELLKKDRVPVFRLVD